MNSFKIVIAGLIAVLISACGGEGTSIPTPQNVTTTSPIVRSVKLSGGLTYDRVPHTENSGLSYSNTISLPIRGAVVEVIDPSGHVLDSTLSGPNGRYELTLGTETQVRLQVKAQLMATETAEWNFRVTDNTQQNRIYALQGSLASTGTQADQIRNLHAPSGWTGQSYGNERSAAPFAILDSVYSAIQTFIQIDPNIEFPPLELHWSENNSPAIGDKSRGQIGSSSYLPIEDSGAIYILGQEDADTDEYDQHVIIHEWGHYFEHQLSRTDTIGGFHSLTDRLDSRVAFSEGWSSALSAIVTGDTVYRDSTGPQQISGFSFDLETADVSSPGWFNEASVGAIIYDIYDNQADDFDGISVGLKPMYDVMRSESYKQSPVFTTIFALADGLRSRGDISQTDINTLLAGHAISGFGPDGIGESNNGAIQTALPLYKEVILNEGPIQFCSLDDAGVFNKLGNRDFMFLNLANESDVTISITKVNGANNRDPDLNIWEDGQIIHRSASSEIDEETFFGRLDAGEYIIEAFDFRNINGTNSQRGDSCFSLSVQG